MFSRPQALALTAGFLLAACEAPITDKTSDTFVGSKSLVTLQAGIWIDPNGCDHWIVDDGLEGYLSQRLDRHGKPVCSGFLPGGVALGDYAATEDIADSF